MAFGVALHAVPAFAARALPPTAQRALVLRGGTATRPLRFLLSLPRGYEQGTQLWPMILYLHGRSRRGNDLDRLRRFSLPAVVDRRAVPFVVVSPQCPADRTWFDLGGLDDLVDIVVHTYRVDPGRVYLTGHSMGGDGVWYLGQRLKDRFAAIAPVAAGKVPLSWPLGLGDMPVWILHGEKDDVTPLVHARAAADALKRAGHPPRFTVLPGLGHDILRVYEDDELYEWFLAHRRNDRAAATDVVDPRD